MTRPTALSLFAGCGGFCEGIELAGFDVRAAVEWDRYAADTYSFNFPETKLFEGDVRKFLVGSGRDDKQQYGLDDGIDLLFGGPPCQGYSQIGTRQLDDERNDLYLEYVRILKLLKPRTFLMENVPNLLLLNKGYYRNKVIAALRSAGYANAAVVRVTASDFGVPQERRRVMFLGTRSDLAFRYDLASFAEEFLNEHRSEKVVTVWDAIGDLPRHVVASGETMPYPRKAKSEYQRLMRLDCASDLYPVEKKRARGIRHFETLALHNHHTKEIQERRLSLIALLEPGKKADSLPKEVWDGARPEKWRRLHPDKPSYTILANMHRDLSEFVHPRLQRWITVREAARLQSFHDGFVFRGSEWQQLKQIGNAVPPLLGRAVGLLAKALLDEVSSSVPKARPVARGRQRALFA